MVSAQLTSKIAMLSHKKSMRVPIVTQPPQHLWFKVVWIFIFILFYFFCHSNSHIVEKEMATHSSILAWKIPWTEEPGGLMSMGSHRVEHDCSDLACMHACIGEGNGNPFQYSCLENPVDRGAWLVAVHGVAQSQT